MTGGPLLVGALTALSVLIFFVGFWRMVVGHQDPVEDRLRQYGGVDTSLADEKHKRGSAAGLPFLTRMMSGFGAGTGLADRLSRSAVPLTAAEFALILLGAAGAGFLLGFVRGGLGLGLVLGLIGGYAPIVYLGMRAGQRQRQFTDQMPQTLDLLVGALRAGYGLNQALNTLVDQMPPPTSDEYRRVVRAIELGLSTQQALSDLADRVNTQDVRLMVTAINVQYEMGGNLAEILTTIGETLRDRVRIQREIRTLTAQQRMSAFVLGALPVGMALILSVVSPGFLDPLFQPGFMRYVLGFAIVMQLIGFYALKRIISIEV